MAAVVGLGGESLGADCCGITGDEVVAVPGRTVLLQRLGVDKWPTDEIVATCRVRCVAAWRFGLRL
jgi:hypothetical protein